MTLSWFYCVLYRFGNNKKALLLSWEIALFHLIYTNITIMIPYLITNLLFLIFLFLPVLPLYVHITSEQSPLSAERVYDLHCVTFGSRPPALVTWWIGNTQLLDHSSQVYSIHFSFSLIFTDPQKSISRRINRAWGYLFVLSNLETL